MDEIKNNEELPNQEPLVFSELKKEEKAAFRKEFSKATKDYKISIIFSIAFLVVILISAFVSSFVDPVYTSITASMTCLNSCLILRYEDKFAKWLKAEKNIVMKRKKAEK